MSRWQLARALLVRRTVVPLVWMAVWVERTSGEVSAAIEVSWLVVACVSVKW